MHGTLCFERKGRTYRNSRSRRSPIPRAPPAQGLTNSERQEQMESVNTMLSGICGTASILCVLAAIVLFAAGKVNDTMGARGEAMMISCIIAAAAFAAGGAYIATQDLSIAI